MRNRFVLSGMATLIIIDVENKCPVKMWRNSNLQTLLVECKMVQALEEKIWWFLKKLNTEFSYDPLIPILSRKSKE